MTSWALLLLVAVGLACVGLVVAGIIALVVSSKRR